MVTTPNRPPSCDKLDKPKLKECPFCGSESEHDAPYPHVRCKTVGCYVCGPNDDPHGHKWNSIPRRSEVADLLRLVEETIISPPTPAEGRLLQYAAKLRKEWNL